MLKISIKNVILGKIVDFFYDISLKGKQSRHRTKFIKLLGEKSKEYDEGFMQILKEHDGLDADGEIKTKESGGTTVYDIDDIDGFVKERNVLNEEEAIIDGSDNQLMLKTVRTVLDEFDEEISGQEAVLYDFLCEQFRVDENLEEVEEEEE